MPSRQTVRLCCGLRVWVGRFDCSPHVICVRACVFARGCCIRFLCVPEISPFRGFRTVTCITMHGETPCNARRSVAERCCGPPGQNRSAVRSTSPWMKKSTSTAKVTPESVRACDIFNVEMKEPHPHTVQVKLFREPQLTMEWSGLAGTHAESGRVNFMGFPCAGASIRTSHPQQLESWSLARHSSRVPVGASAGV